MLLPSTRMAMKTNLNRTNVTTTIVATRASVRRGCRPTKARPHQVEIRRAGLFAASGSTSNSFNTHRAVEFRESRNAGEAKNPGRRRLLTSVGRLLLIGNHLNHRNQAGVFCIRTMKPVE